ncbi:hypothetical protein DACRYDRAFT_22769 [Dacryopinax primogenitus]|uniref:Uncharacterized protein n=1 Tax=Dacryopinax primogenitus (strain DJM 731) TaxID=1858805 RepID=M5FTF5_DACPD|nr:uncharacterized protein DACRYDRAFT_22769 [Dacryopinax primogenitus]EJU00916.1 hypothetical protein DACRYDRAFT_22769 [Dacryopinax primogenitus]
MDSQLSRTVASDSENDSTRTNAGVASTLPVSVPPSSAHLDAPHSGEGRSILNAKQKQIAAGLSRLLKRPERKAKASESRVEHYLIPANRGRSVPEGESVPTTSTVPGSRYFERGEEELDSYLPPIAGPSNFPANGAPPHSSLRISQFIHQGKEQAKQIVPVVVDSDDDSNYQESKPAPEPVPEPEPEHERDTFAPPNRHIHIFSAFSAPPTRMQDISSGAINRGFHFSESSYMREHQGEADLDSEEEDDPGLRRLRRALPIARADRHAAGRSTVALGPAITAR